jgi:hypothetical protein
MAGGPVKAGAKRSGAPPAGLGLDGGTAICQGEERACGGATTQDSRGTREHARGAERGTNAVTLLLLFHQTKKAS